jgi:hypothetical protein
MRFPDHRQACYQSHRDGTSDQGDELLPERLNRAPTKAQRGHFIFEYVVLCVVREVRHETLQLAAHFAYVFSMGLKATLLYSTRRHE